MCSNCSGDYEDPENTQWPDRESTEDEALEAIELGAIEEMIEDFNSPDGFTPLAEHERALNSIRKASEQVAEGAFLLQELRERGILP